MRVLLTILATVLLVATAQAQAHKTGGTGGGARGGDPAAEARKKRENEEIDRAYKAAIDQVPTAQKSDPWGGVRDADTAKKKK